MRLLIYGSRDYARTVSELAEDCGHEIVGLIDDTDPTRDGVVGCFDDAVGRHRDCGVVLGIGYTDLLGRWAAWGRVLACGLSTPTLIHPRAYVARTAILGSGGVVMAGAIVDQRAHLGEAVVVWPGVCINHDTVIGDNCFISPHAVLCGHVTLGANTFVGAGAAVADHCRVPAGSRIRMLERYVDHRGGA